MLDLQSILEELNKVQIVSDLENFDKKYLSKSWLLNEEFKKIGSLSNEEKKDFGKKMSEIKNTLTSAYAEKEKNLTTLEINKKLEKDIIDISVEAKTFENWSYSVLANIRREVEDICKSFGFLIEYWYEVVSKFENFQAVNIPLTHPATEMHDTIYLNEKDQNWEWLILRTHTSSMQNLLMRKYWVPLKVVIPSKVYRFENLDARHDTMFYQLEWLYVDKDVNIANFKDIITKILSAILKSEVEVRMRPWYFPFVEPWFEIDARYEIYDQKTWKKELSKWIEILWAWMVHPNVLKEAGIDSNEYKWFAFWIWINRIAAMRYGIKDIRYFTNWDLRFAKTFWQ